MRAAVINFPGSTGGEDIKEAFMSVGLKGQQVELLNEKEQDLSAYDLVFIAGGASYGDSIRPGAAALVDPISESILEFSKAGKRVVGIGNGFQILTELNLLPGAFLKNASTKTVNKLVELKVANGQTALTNQLNLGDNVRLPIAHKYGQYFIKEEELEEVKENKQIIFTYEGSNPNGSTAAIAGVMNKEETVFGLMAHPERAMEEILGSADGAQFFKSIVKEYK